MISTVNLALRFAERALFENVNIKFTSGNCYGLIGANGSGKSTFLKLLSKEITPSKGDVVIQPNKRLAVLKQNQFEFDEYKVLDTVIMGHKRLYEIMNEKNKIYEKPNFSDEDGIIVSELETEFAELDGWEAESNAATLLNGIGIETDLHEKQMSELVGNDKVKVLLAQALFGNPDILLLDEPTNHLDIKAINWLENFLLNFDNTVIVVSHDRHFLNKTCTHIADIDYSKIQIFVGNYNFWYESSQLILKQLKDQNKKMDLRKKELQEFIQRFSANASKSKQATSRKKLLENLTIEDIKPSSRRYPFIDFKQEREVGNDLLSIKGLKKSVGEEVLLNNIDLIVNKGDKIAFVGSLTNAKTILFNILTNKVKPDSGEYNWGITTTRSYFAKENSEFFDNVNLSLVDWLRQYSKDQTETFIRGWLGRILFSGEEALKNANVLSGGERVRCILTKIMLEMSNVLILDEPTNHLDLESITALNNGLIRYKGTLLFTSHDHQFIQTIANRIIEITPNGIIDYKGTYDEYLETKNLI
ncbi:MAG: ATP-binding cassette domain-containing protein [Clostridiales bacterium]